MVKIIRRIAVMIDEDLDGHCIPDRYFGIAQAPQPVVVQAKYDDGILNGRHTYLLLILEYQYR